MTNNEIETFIQEASKEIEEFTRAHENNPGDQDIMGQLIDAYKKRGAAYQQTGNIGKALADFDNCTAIAVEGEYRSNIRVTLFEKVSDNGGPLDRGYAYLELEQYDKAIDEFETALSSGRHDKEAKEALVRTYYIRALWHNFKGHDTQNVINDYEAVVKDGSYRLADAKRSLFSVYCKRGQDYDGKGKHKEATADFEKALPFAPSDADAASVYYMLGQAYCNAKEYDQAIKAHTNAINLKKDPTYYEGRGEAYYSKKEYPPAIIDYETAIRLAPNNASWYTGIGMVYAVQGDDKRAVKAYETAISYNRNDVAAYSNLGDVHKKTGDYGQAVANYTMTLNLIKELGYPETAAAIPYYKRGDAYTKIGDYARAVSDFEQAARLKPQNENYTKALAETAKKKEEERVKIETEARTRREAEHEEEKRKTEEERKNKRERQIILSIVGMVVGIGLSLAAVGIGMTGIGILIFFIATIVGIGGIIGAKYESTHTKNGCQTPF